MTGNLMQGINHFIRVEQVWSYNLIGSLKESMNIDMRLVNDVYTKTAAFLLARHQFYISKDNLQYNAFINSLREHFECYTPGFNHFFYYLDNLFRIISPALAQIQSPIKSVTTITTDTGDIEGFVFGT
ncbi:hypothetical protein [Pseudomonas phage D6]|nr:hypothetical protein [Pseudomonas phage D6]